MSRSARRASVLASLTIALAAAVPAAAAEDPASQPPFGGERPPELVPASSPEEIPPGFALSPAEAIEIAAATDVVRAELAETADAKPVVFRRGERWQVSYLDGAGPEVAQVIIDGRSGVVAEAWRDFQVETKLARGYEGAVAQVVNSPWIWIPLCLAFVAPFIDPKRPFRLLHLDLLAIVGLSVSLYFFNRGEISASVALTYPVLAYLLIRMLIAGLRPRGRDGPLIAVAPVRLLVAGVVVLGVGRIALNIADSQVIDVGVASVIGADRVAGGEPLYEGAFSPGIDLKGDVYGPAAYLAYVPFELAFPWEGTWDDVPAAHAAAIAFDLACLLGLIALGRRLRDGEEGRALGWALGFAWVACPWTLYAMNANANDGLVAALGIGAMLALTAPAVRGGLTAIASVAKFGSAALAPLFATGTGERRWRQAAIFSVAFAAVSALCVLPFLGDGGVREFYDRTLGYQATRGSPFSVWGQAPSLDFAQPLARVGAVALALAVAFFPARKTPLQIAALAAAVAIALQLTATHWFYFYVVWFLPFALIAAFGSQQTITRSESPTAPAAAS